MDWAGLHVFGLPGCPDTSTADHFFQAYHDLRLAAYDSALLPRSTETLEGVARIRFAADRIPLGITVVDCAHLDTLSLRDGLLKLGPDSMLYDVAGRSRSPWLLRRTAVAAPLVMGELTQGQHVFELNADLINTHLTTLPLDRRAVDYIKVDFDDGNAPVGLRPGQQTTVTYSTYGLRVLQFSIVLRDGTTVTAKGALMVNEVSARTTAVDKAPCLVDQFNSTIPFAGSVTGGDAYYYYRDGVPCGGSRQQLRKPIIMVDGFDPNNGRDGREVFNNNLGYNNGLNLGTQLRDDGYDVIILDFSGSRSHAANDGADYLERNAMVLVELINRVNAELLANGSTEKLVVIGPSMGGLIARYALAYMEANPTAPYTDRATGQRRTPPVFPGGGPSHHTRLYVSFDSPHLGANIMIGAQLFVEFFARMGNRDAEKGRDKLNSIAARQMLLDHYDYHLSAGQSVIAPAPERYPFKQHLYQNGLPGSGGWPTQLRKVTMVNGSMTGVGMHQPGRAAFSMKVTFVRGWRRLFAGLGSLITLSKGQVSFTQGYGTDGEVFMGTYPPVPFRSGRQEEHRWSASKPGICSLDNAPGGYYSTQAEIHSPDDPSGPKTWFGKALNIGPIKWDKITNEHSFIPTISALAFQSAPGMTGVRPDLDHDLCDNTLADRDLICSGNTPFDAYYGPRGANEDHVALTTGNVDFIRREILVYDAAGVPLRKLATPVLSGVPEVLCNGTTARVRATNCHAVEYVWTATNNITINGQSGTANAYDFTVVTTSPTVTLGQSAINTSYGGGSISVRARNAPEFADSDPAADNFQVGSGMILIDDNSNGAPLCTGDDVTFTARSWGMVDPIQWMVDSATYHNATGNSFTFIVPPGAATQYTISAHSVEACSGDAYANSRDFTVRRVGCPRRPAPGFNVYPNPTTTGELTIEADRADATSYTATLHDGFGQARRQTAATTSRSILSTAGLPTGLYHLTITTADGTRDRRTVDVR